MTRKKAAVQDASLFEGDAVTEAERPNETQAKVIDQSPQARNDVVPAKPSKAVARRSTAKRPAVVASAVAHVMETIERLAVNPNVGADKIGLLLDAQERILDRNARMAFDAAMVEMQPHLPEITKDGRIIVREKNAATGKRDGEETQNTPYAKWEKIVPLVKPILHEFGFSLTHRSATAPDGRLRVTAILKGHGFTDDSCYLDLSADTSGSKNNAQGWASALSYAKRHTGCAALNIVTKDEDDDARRSGPIVTIGEPLSPEQIDMLIELARAVECPAPHLIAHLNKKRPKNHPEAKMLEHLPAARFNEITEALRSYEQNKKARNAEQTTKQ